MILSSDMPSATIEAEPELISDDPRIDPVTDYSGPDFPTAYEAAVERYGPLVPQSAIPASLGVTHQSVSLLLKKDAFTKLTICHHLFVPLSEIKQRIEDKKAGRLSRGGRGKKLPARKAD